MNEDNKKIKNENSYFSYPVEQQNGVLVLNKPRGISSAQAIARIKHGFGQRKIGHGGTLDPMAEGVLLVLLGQGTKLSDHLMNAGEKIYSGSILLGVETDTLDMEGEIVAEKSTDSVSIEAVEKAMQELVGTYQQEVPAYSAAKHKGQALYKLAREGKPTPVKKKLVTVFDAQVELVDLKHVKFRVKCSSGTYIRSLAHSLGIRLGCGAALEKLIREHSYPFNLEDSLSFEDLSKNPEKFCEHVHGFTKALPDWPVINIKDQYLAQVKNGQALPYRVWEEAPDFEEGSKALFMAEDNSPLALVEATKIERVECWRVFRGLWN